MGEIPLDIGSPFNTNHFERKLSYNLDCQDFFYSVCKLEEIIGGRDQSRERVWNTYIIFVLCGFIFWDELRYLKMRKCF